MPIRRIVRSSAAGADPEPTDLITAAELSERIQGPGGTLALSEVEALLEAALALVDRYAPAAPAALRREAVIRIAGYWAEADFGAIAKEGVGPRDLTWVTNHAGAFYRSGAAGLIGPWRNRTAGVAG